MFWIPIGIGIMLGSEKGRRKLLQAGKVLKDSVVAFVNWDIENQKIVDEHEKKKQKEKRKLKNYQEDI